jgi:hypothetical protein
MWSRMTDTATGERKPGVEGRETELGWRTVGEMTGVKRKQEMLLCEACSNFKLWSLEDTRETDWTPPALWRP